MNTPGDELMYYETSAQRRKAKEALKLVKERDQKRIEEGWRYVRCEDGLLRLRKPQKQK